MRFSHPFSYIINDLLFTNPQVANVVFFLVTVYFLVDHWRTASTLTKSGENKGNFLIVIKLFFIMGTSQGLESTDCTR